MSQSLGGSTGRDKPDPPPPPHTHPSHTHIHTHACFVRTLTHASAVALLQYRFMDDMHGTGLWRNAEGEETQREYDRGDLIRESPIVGRNTHSDE